MLVIDSVGHNDTDWSVEKRELLSVLLEEEGDEFNVFPLSFAQQRLWFLDTLEARTSAYNISLVARLSGRLNIAALRAAVNEITRRHEALRTTFSVVAGSPVQVISPEITSELTLIDATRQSRETAAGEKSDETNVASLVTSEIGRPFDLSRGPLLRTTLFRLNPDEHIFVTVIHHIVSDGWSTGVIVRELAALYTAFAAGLQSTLHELPIQYADFSQWQHETMTGEFLEGQLGYWRSKLGGELPALDLPSDHSRPATPSFRGAAVGFWVPRDCASSLEALSRQQGATPFMTLLAAFQTLLYRYSGQPDVLVGAPVANRNRAEVEGLIGFFVNTLVLRADLSGDPTFRDLLNRVKEVTLDAYGHQDLPFERLVTDLRPDRDMSRNPIFQVLFALQNAPMDAVELPGLTLAIEDPQTASARFDLELHLWEKPQGIKGSLVYSLDLFCESSMRRMVGHFQTLLESVAANPDRRISALPILTAEEEKQLLVEFNHTSGVYPHDFCIHHLFSRQADQAADQIALVFEDHELSYRELSVRTNKLAHYLRRLGAGPDCVVGIFMERSVEMLIGVLGILKAGSAYLPLDPAYPEERLCFALGDAGVDIVLTQQDLHARLPGSASEVICLDRDWEIIAGHSEEEPAGGASPANLAYLIYTSGSTGVPKGVAMQHGPLVNLIDWQIRRSGALKSPRTLQFTSLSFDVSFQEIFSTWCAGGALVLLSDQDRRNPARLLEALTERRVERLFLPFVALQYLAETAEREVHEAMVPTCLREVITAGEQLKITRQIRGLFRKLGQCKLDNQYGPAEAHVVSGHMLDGAEAVAWPELPPIGRPISNARLYVLDQQMQVAPVGVTGELYIAGDCVARGYLDRADTTAVRFLPDAYAVRGGTRLYKTGDLARWSADGSIQFLGRNDDQVKIRGYRVEIGEVESALRGHPQVREAAAVVKETNRLEKRLVAYVLVDQPANLMIADLRAFIRDRLPEYMVPQTIVPVETFPLTPSGKINKRALPEPEQVETKVEGNRAGQRAPVEEILAGIWSELIGARSISGDDNFFELGGHSLLAAQVVSRIRDVFNIELPIRVLFEEPTLGRMARSIKAEMESGGGRQLAPVTRAPRGGAIPPSFSQQRLWFIHQLEPEAAVYTLPLALWLRGRLNVATLEMSLSEVIRRHEALRTVIVAADSELSQVITDYREATFPMIDLSALPPGESEATALRIARLEARRPFDLEQGPLIRASLITLNADERLLLCTAHHIVCDGWSLDILVREVAALDEAFSKGEPSFLADLPVQYADYACQQRGWLQGEALDTHLAYWRKQLKGAPALALPTDKARPAVQTWSGATEKVTIGEELTAELKLCARREGVTLYMLLLAAFKVLLHRYANQEDITVGSPIAGRNQSEIEGLIGLFINVLVIRSEVAGGDSFRSFLRRVRKTVLDAYSHQDAPFDKLVDELGPERNLSQAPLFQVMFALHNASRQSLVLPGIEVSALDIDNGTSRFDLTLELVERGDTIEGWFEYKTDLFEASRIARMATHFSTMLKSVVADPRQSLSDAPLLAESERRLLINEWNATSRSYDAGKCIHQLFEEQAERRPDRIAVVFRNQQISYVELNRRANQLAHYLMTLGAGPGEIVGVCVDRSIEMLVGLLAVLKTGAAYVPLDRFYPKERLAFILEDARAGVVVTRAESLLDLPPINGQVVNLDSEWVRIEAQPDANPLSGVTPDGPAYVIYTSGSTGVPKGVVVTHRNVANFFTGMDHGVGAEPDGTWLAVTSIAFDISVYELFWTLGRGFKVVLQEDHKPLPDSAGQPEISEKKIDFSLFYFAAADGKGADDKYRLLLDGAKFADEHGFTAVWTPERHFHAFGGLYPNPAVAGAAIAALTKRVQIRAGSVVLPLHHPARVAEEWSVVDNLSGGRVGISFASGWQMNDFVFAPDSYSRRAALMYEQIEIVQRLWRGESATFSGVDGKQTEVRILPSPLQPELPVWVTAAGSVETFRSAGRIGAGLLTHLLGQSVDELAEKILAYRQARGEAGYDPDSGCVTLMLHTFIGPDLDLVREKVREPFCAYLMQSACLAQNLARSMGYDIDFMSLSHEEREEFLLRSFDRYFETSGLLGTPATCLRMVERLKGIGVNEVACLIDFGVDHDSVMSSLKRLNLIKEIANGRSALARQGDEIDKDDYSICSKIMRHGVTHLQCTPSMAGMIMAEESAPEALKSLREIMLGGEAMPPALGGRLLEIASGRVRNMYGPTETTVWSTIHTLDKAGGAIPIGRPIANTQTYILDQSLQVVPIGVAGNLHIGGDGVVPGYLRRPDLTADRFIPNPFASTPGARMYCAGDVARHLEGGDIEFLGRADNQVKLRGYRIELGEIETALGNHPAVREAVVAVRNDEAGGDRLVAYVAPRTAAAPTRDLRGRMNKDVLNGHSRTTLPNGLLVAHHDSPQTSAIYREIFEQGVYAKHGITFNDGDCIFDVGSNIGLFTIFANQKCKDPTIYAFEPIPRTFDLLRVNVALYGLNVKLFDAGVADFEGVTQFTFYPEASGLSGRSVYSAEDKKTTRTVIANWMKRVAPEQLQSQDLSEFERAFEQTMRSETYDCRVTTLSRVIRDHNVERVDLLKIDVEGAEVDALNGIEECDWPKIRQLVMEIDTKEALEQIKGQLQKRGFTFAVEQTTIIEDGQSYVYTLYATRAKRDRATAPSESQTGATASETQSASLTIPQLRSYLKERLPEYMVPSAFVLLDALPLTPNGKVDRRALPDPEVSRDGAVAPYEAPQNEIESAVAEIWRETLRVGRVGINDNFFDLGGNSLLLVTLHGKLKKAFARDISIVELFRSATVSAQARYLAAGSQEQSIAARVQGRATTQAQATNSQARLNRERAKKFRERASHKK